MLTYFLHALQCVAPERALVFFLYFWNHFSVFCFPINGFDALTDSRHTQKKCPAADQVTMLLEF